MPTNKTLSRSEDRVIAGVIGGLAKHFGVDPTILRLATAFLAIATCLVPGVIIYGVAIVLMSKSSSDPDTELTASTGLPGK